MFKLFSLSLLTFGLLNASASAVSQYPCDKVIYENVTNRDDRKVQVCLSDTNVVLTVDAKSDGTEKIDIRLPASNVSYTQQGTANTLAFDLSDDIYFTVSTEKNHVRLLTVVEHNLSRSYRLQSPTVDDLSPSLVKYGIIQK